MRAENFETASDLPYTLSNDWLHEGISSHAEGVL